MKQGDLVFVKCSGEPVVVSNEEGPDTVTIRLNGVTGQYEALQIETYALETPDERTAREFGDFVRTQELVSKLRDASQNKSQPAAGLN